MVPILPHSLLCGDVRSGIEDEDRRLHRVVSRRFDSGNLLRIYSSLSSESVRQEGEEVQGVLLDSRCGFLSSFYKRLR